MNARRIFGAAAVISLILGGIEAPLASKGAGASTTECTLAAIQAKAPEGTTITAAAIVAAADNLPQYCRVDGHVATPGTEVNFRLGLPA